MRVWRRWPQNGSLNIYFHMSTMITHDGQCFPPVQGGHLPRDMGWLGTRGTMFLFLAQIGRHAHLGDEQTKRFFGRVPEANNPVTANCLPRNLFTFSSPTTKTACVRARTRQPAYCSFGSFGLARQAV